MTFDTTSRTHKRIAVLLAALLMGSTAATATAAVPSAGHDTAVAHVVQHVGDRG